MRCARDRREALHCRCHAALRRATPRTDHNEDPTKDKD
jgi:hypothetical protein